MIVIALMAEIRDVTNQMHLPDVPLSLIHAAEGLFLRSLSVVMRPLAMFLRTLVVISFHGQIMPRISDAVKPLPYAPKTFSNIT